MSSDIDSNRSQLEDMHNMLKPRMKKIFSTNSNEAAKTTLILDNFLQKSRECENRQYEGKALLWYSKLPDLPLSEQEQYASNAVDVLKYQENSLYADSLYNLAVFLNIKGEKADACKLLKKALRIYQEVDRTWRDHDQGKAIISILNDWGC